MKQSRGMSFGEAVFSTAIGLGVSITANMLILPPLGYAVTWGDSAIMSVCFTALSVVRSFCVRRLFEAWR